MQVISKKKRNQQILKTILKYILECSKTLKDFRIRFIKILFIRDLSYLKAVNDVKVMHSNVKIISFFNRI